MYEFEIKDNVINIYVKNQLVAVFDSRDWQRKAIGFTDVRLRPGGEKVMHYLQALPTSLGGRIAQPHIDVEKVDNGLSLYIKCETKDQRIEHATQIGLTYQPERDRVLYDCQFRTNILKTCSADLNLLHPGRRWHGTPYESDGVWLWEFTDPCFENLVGPSTAITQDRPEITCPVPLFTKGGWRKRWKTFVYSDSKGNLVSIPHNHFDSHEKDCWLHGAGGFVGLFGEPGMDFVFRDIECPNQTQVANRLCMWGYDLHFYRVVKSDLKTPPVLEAGEVFENGFTIELLDNKESEEITSRAKDYFHDEEELQRRHVPRYTPGTNLLDEELQDHDESCFWEPGTNARWTKDTGCLVLENNYHCINSEQNRNCWETRVGSSRFGDPIRSGIPYKLTAEVRTEEETKGLARIGINWLTGRNLGSFYEETFWSEPMWSQSLTGFNGWTKLEVVTPPTPEELVCEVRIVLELVGPGRAWFQKIQLGEMEAGIMTDSNGS